MSGDHTFKRQTNRTLTAKVIAVLKFDQQDDSDRTYPTRSVIAIEHLPEYPDMV